MMKRMSCAVALLVIFNTTLYGEQIRLTNAQVGFLRAPTATQDDRLLLKFDLPAGMGDRQIDIAAIRLTIPVDTSLKRPVSFTVFPVVRSWDPANVSWSRSWTAPGGDFNDVYVTTVTIVPKRNRTAVIDLTPLARLWAREATGNFGVILVPIPDEGQVYKLLPVTPSLAPEMGINISPR